MDQDLKNQCTAIAYILHIALPKEETEEMLLFIGENAHKALKIGNKQVEFCEYILNNNAHYTPLKNVENIAAYLDAFLKRAVIRLYNIEKMSESLKQEFYKQYNLE